MNRLLFVSLWFAGLALGAVPAPEAFFGHAMGADRKLLDWAKVVSYFEQLEKNSDRIRVERLGTSTEGRPFIAATIASSDTLRRLDRYKEIQSRLADPRKTSPEEAAKLVAEGKTVVLITCSIHATEVASTASAIEFTYRLLTEDKPKFRAILENTIFILVPSLNPDGVDIVTQWYRKTLGTPYEGTSPPQLYHKYVGHDNNRDWYIFSQVETQLTISKLHNVWRPQIVYDIHQQGAYASRMFVPPWLDPIDPNIDPIIAQLCNAIGAGMAADLTSAGKTGIAINAMYDFWTPARHYQAYHGGLRILSESASARIATPIKVEKQGLSQSALGYNPRERSWNHLEPWMGGEWKLRDIVDYQLIAMESCLYQAAMRREDLLNSFYRIGRRAIERPSPYAFVISSRQTDPGASRKLLQTLAQGDVEIEKTIADFTAGGHSYPAGSYVIRMRQPYSSYAKTLLEKQVYPDLRAYPDGPPRRPYDVTAHTLPLLMGVAVDTVTEEFKTALARAESFDFPAVSAESTLAATDTETWRKLNAALDAKQQVWRNQSTGDFLVGARPTGDFRSVKRPRIGLYKSFVPSMDEGWTRWLLEQFGFPYTSIFNRDVQAGNLRDRFDAIIVPDQRGETIARGHKSGAMPAEYTGGLGELGAEAFKQFASRGGVLIFLNEASEYALEYLGIPVKDSLAGVSTREFYAPGSLLNVRLAPHPLTLGLPQEIPVWFESGPAFDLSGKGTAVGVYPETGVLASGWLLGEKYVSKRAAIADVPMGSGHIILFGIRPQYRAQSYQSFKLLFNALLHFE